MESCAITSLSISAVNFYIIMVQVGFEPTKHNAPDLKSGPFDRSGTEP